MDHFSHTFWLTGFEYLSYDIIGEVKLPQREDTGAFCAIFVSAACIALDRRFQQQGSWTFNPKGSATDIRGVRKKEHSTGKVASEKVAKSEQILQSQETN